MLVSKYSSFHKNWGQCVTGDCWTARWIWHCFLLMLDFTTYFIQLSYTFVWKGKLIFLFLFFNTKCSLDESQWSWPSSWTVRAVAQMVGCMLEQQAETKTHRERFIVSSKTCTLYCPFSICSATAAVSLYLLGQRVWQNERIMTIKHPWHLHLIRKVFWTAFLMMDGGHIGSVAYGTIWV